MNGLTHIFEELLNRDVEEVMAEKARFEDWCSMWLNEGLGGPPFPVTRCTGACGLVKSR